jgi:hypothetical protein
VAPGDTSSVISAACPAGKKLLGGGGAVEDSKFHVTYLYSQVNDAMGQMGAAGRLQRWSS